MPASTASIQGFSSAHAATHQETLRTQRLDRYLEEPMSDGNPLAALVSQPASTSDKNIAEAAESKMTTKIENILKPFHKAG